MILNTKQDYINYLEINPEAAKEELQELLTSRYSWMDKDVVDVESGLAYAIDDTHRVIGDEDEQIYQVYEEDMTAKLFILGFTVKEVEELINEN